MVEKIFSIFFEIDHLRCIFAQKYDSRCQNSLKCKKFGQFHSFVIFVRIKGGKNKEYSHLRLFWRQESNFWAKYMENGLFQKNWENFFGHFLTKMHIFAITRRLKVIYCLQFVWGPPTIYLSRVKYQVSTYEWQRFQKCTTFWGTLYMTGAHV